jgi:hypothetical protein
VPGQISEETKSEETKYQKKAANGRKKGSEETSYQAEANMRSKQAIRQKQM